MSKEIIMTAVLAAVLTVGSMIAYEKLVKKA